MNKAFLINHQHPSVLAVINTSLSQRGSDLELGRRELFFEMKSQKSSQVDYLRAPAKPMSLSYNSLAPTIFLGPTQAAKHWEYHSSETVHLYPAAHMVGPVQPEPPH
jgi:hypothetical protein